VVVLGYFYLASRTATTPPVSSAYGSPENNPVPSGKVANNLKKGTTAFYSHGMPGFQMPLMSQQNLVQL
jgi:hypothetical protein